VFVCVCVLWWICFAVMCLDGFALALSLSCTWTVSYMSMYMYSNFITEEERAESLRMARMCITYGKGGLG